MKQVIFTIMILLFSATAGLVQVAIIANKSVPADTIKKNDLLDFYTGDIKKWSNDLPVIVLDLKPKNDVKKTFYKFLGKSSSRMKSIWLKKMLSGESDPPESLPSEDEVLNKIISTPGAIGFIRQSRVSSKVKTLLIIKDKKK